MIDVEHIGAIPDEEPEDLGDPADRVAPSSGIVVHHGGALVPWLKLRHMLGRSRDRRRWLQFHCATTGYRPHGPKQIAFHLHSSGAEPEVRTNKLAVTGIRFGKTTMAINEHYMLHAFNPGCDHIMVAPTYDQCREVLLRGWDMLAESGARAGYPLLKRWNWSLLRADLVCGGRVFFRSADKIENTRGFTLASDLIDEGDYTRQPLDVLHTLAGRLSAQDAYVRQLTVTTTPYEYNNSIIQFWADTRSAAKELPDPEERTTALRSWWFMRASTFDNPTLTPDFKRDLERLSKSEYAKEALGYAILHRQARFAACWDRARYLVDERSPVTRADLINGYDKSLPYDMGIDWGLHRPAYTWIQVRRDGSAIVFFEYCPDDVGEEQQLDAVWRVCKALGKDPQDAAVDRNDVRQIDRFKTRFRRTRVVTAETRPEQDRKLSASSILGLLDPLGGQPLLYVHSSLAGHEASKRGVVAMFENAAWEWDVVRKGYKDIVEKDGVFDHSFDSLGLWAKLLGLEKRRGTQLRDIIGEQGRPSRLDDIRRALGLEPNS